MDEINKSAEPFQRLWYGDVPELKTTKELEAMSLDEVRASIEMVKQFKSLLLCHMKCEDSKALVRQSYNRFSDALYEKAMELAEAEDDKQAISSLRRGKEPFSIDQSSGVA